MVKSSNEALVPVSFWAVGRLAETSQVAIRLNDLPPIFMSVEIAREIAVALKAEVSAVSQKPAAVASLPSPKRSPNSSRRLMRSPKK